MKDIENVYPLHKAVDNSILSSQLKALVENGAHLNVTDSLGNTPLHICVKEESGDFIDSLQCIRYLVTKGADVNRVNNCGNAPLHTAARMGRSRSGLYLLSRGADPRITNKEKMTPLHLAARINCSDLVAALVERGAELNQRTIAERPQSTKQHVTTHLKPCVI